MYVTSSLIHFQYKVIRIDFNTLILNWHSLQSMKWIT